MSVLENNANRSSSSVISHPHGSEQEDSDEDERLSVAPGSQEGEFSSGLKQVLTKAVNAMVRVAYSKI
jgi:hypothetical protein